MSNPAVRLASNTLRSHKSGSSNQVVHQQSPQRRVRNDWVSNYIIRFAEKSMFSVRGSAKVTCHEEHFSRHLIQIEHSLRTRLLRYHTLCKNAVVRAQNWTMFTSLLSSSTLVHGSICISQH